MRRAGLAAFVLLASCVGSEGPEAEATLRFLPDLAEGFAALPRVASETPQARAVNATLDRIDVGDRQNRADCLEMKPYNDNVEWGRIVEAPMTGPRFVSIVVTRGDYCGGAHPNWERTPLVFDLETGRLIDWRALLPAAMVEPIEDDSGPWGLPAHLTSPALKSWFAERALAEMDAYGRADCTDLYNEWRDSWGLVAWPDAKAAGLTLQTAGLAHAQKGCLTEVTIPLGELRRRGVRRELTDALEAAHRARLWRDAPPEQESGR